MMEVVPPLQEILETAATQGLIELTLLPGLSPQELHHFVNSQPCPVPSDLLQLLAFTSGLQFTSDRLYDVDFTGCFQ